MEISDKIAIGIVAVCLILSFTSFYKILVKLYVGLFLSAFLLLGLVIATSCPEFNEVTSGVFQEGSNRRWKSIQFRSPTING